LHKNFTVSERETVNRYVIGDIHGCNRTFGKLLKKINISKSDEIYILGDMINRGSNSSGVLNRIIKLKKQGFKIFPLKGNHEQMLLTVINNEPERLFNFLRFYKSSDLLSMKGKIKKKYIKLLETLPTYFELDNFILVHAALDLSNDNIFENQEFMLSSRYQRGNISQLEGKILIHGHTVSDFETIKERINERSQIICIDNGCIYGDSRKGFGRLVCLNIDKMEIISKRNCENA